MSRPTTPRVSLPDVVHRKPVQRGPNSWAQAAEKAGVIKIPNPGPATNRDKYENKPMPPLPRPSEHGAPLNMPGKPGYIQPATPLNPTNQGSSKHRAVTDPVSSKPLFGGAKIGELRRKFSGAKIHTASKSIEATVRPRTPAPEPSELPAQSSGSNKFRHDQNPASAPLSTTDPCYLAENLGRQHQSTPVPTHQQEASNLHSVGLTPEEAVDPDGIIQGDGKLNPTRKGTYGTVGEVEFVEGKPEHRVASIAGVIETAEPCEGENLSEPPSAHTSSSSADTYRGQNLTYLLQPTTYSPSNYGGVWENDPQVGHTLPPFSPMRPDFHPEHHHKNSSEGSRATVPLVPGNDASFSNRFSVYPPALASANSWAPQQPPHSAIVPPLFSQNHVPRPPSTYRDYAPPTGPLPNELARLELTLHHHIDSCLGSLSRLVTDKHDQTTDQLIRRLEDQDRKIEKAMKATKADIKEIKQHVESLTSDSAQLQRSEEGLKESLKTSHANTDAVHEKLSSIISKLTDVDQSLAHLRVRLNEVGPTRDQPAIQLRRQSIYSDHPQQRESLSPIRSLSTHPSPTLPSQRQLYQSGTNRSSDGSRQGNTASRARRVNTASGGTQSGDGRDSRRAYYAEMGASIGEAPDLRQHPAFMSPQGYGSDTTGAPVGMSSDGSLFRMPSFTGQGPNGWYQQAYGQ